MLAYFSCVGETNPSNLLHIFIYYYYFAICIAMRTVFIFFIFHISELKTKVARLCVINLITMSSEEADSIRPINELENQLQGKIFAYFRELAFKMALISVDLLDELLNNTDNSTASVDPFDINLPTEHLVNILGSKENLP